MPEIVLQGVTKRFGPVTAVEDLTARILDRELGDRVSALDKYQMALDLDPGHLPSLAAMRAIQLDNGDWLAAAKHPVVLCQRGDTEGRVGAALARLAADFAVGVCEPFAIRN
ncbi:MAG: hypothetical protein ACK40A_01910, partial [Pannonibacter indicus]